jgi:transposase-like protein
MGNPKRYSKEFQERAVRRVRLGESLSRLVRDLGVHRTLSFCLESQAGPRSCHHGRTAESDRRDARIEELEAEATRLEGMIGGQWQ